ncbi:hypothetical protein [Plantactinospora sp. DSM 117369]
MSEIRLPYYDGRPQAQAALRPVIGAEKVVRMFVGGLPRVDALITGEPTVVNGNPALVLRLDGEIDGVLTVRVDKAASVASTTCATGKS